MWPHAQLTLINILAGCLSPTLTIPASLRLYRTTSGYLDVNRIMIMICIIIYSITMKKSYMMCCKYIDNNNEQICVVSILF